MQFNITDHERNNGKCRQTMFMFIKLFVMLVAVLLALGAVAACSSLQTINAITTTNTYHKVADVAYGSDPRQKLDVYAPSPNFNCCDLLAVERFGARTGYGRPVCVDRWRTEQVR